MRYGLAAVLAVAACGGSTDPNAPAPWHSGSRVRAQLYRSDDLSAFAGRYNTMIDFSCRYDEASRTFVDCPPRVETLYRDTDCVQRDLVARDAFTTYAVADVIGGTSYVGRVGTLDGSAYMPDDLGTCTVSAGTTTWAVVDEVDAQDLALGAEAEHAYDGVTYGAIETDDGFSVITRIDGPTHLEVDSSNGRLRNRFEVNGAVRRFVGIHDTLLDVPCNESDGRCLPQPASARLMFPNETCTNTSTVMIGDEIGIARWDSGLYYCDQPVTGTWSYPYGSSGCMVVTGSKYACSLRTLDDFAPLTLDQE